MGAADRNRRAAPPEGPVRVTVALGIDVGGTKIAAGVVDPSTGRRPGSAAGADETRARRRGGAARLRRAGRRARRRAACRSGSACASWSTSTAGRRARTRSTGAASTRRPRSSAPRVVVESDLRAAALAEARFGAGAGVSPFLFAIVGTGASACLVVDGRPYAGGRGEALVLGAPPVEQVASGPALARAAGLERAEDVLADPAHAPLVDAAAAALGSVLAVLANALDPSLVVLGGGPRRARRRSGSASSGRVRHSSRTPAFRRFRSSARSSHRTEA